MAATESASASLGPRYAPEDPTLPKPWMGLIDGSTGIQYYWNPETNVTQYEKPSSAPPPLPPGPPPSKTTPLQAEQTAQPNETVTQFEQQMVPQSSQPLQQQIQMQPLCHQNQLQPPGQQLHFHQPNQQFYYMQQGQNFPHHQPEQHPPPSQKGQQFSQQQLGQHASQPPDQQLGQQHSAQHLAQQQLGQQLPQKQLRQHLPPHLSMQQFPYQLGQQFSYQQSGQQPIQQQSDISGQPLQHQQPGQQSSHQQPGHQLHNQKPGPQMTHPHLNQIPNQQFNYPQQMPLLQTLQSPGMQNSQKQDEQSGFQEMEGTAFQQVKQGAHSVMQVQQSGSIPSNPKPSDGTAQMQAPQTSGYASKLELQTGGPPFTVQQSDPSLLHMRQGINSTQRHQLNDVSRGAYQPGPVSVNDAISMKQSIGLKDCKEDEYRRSGDEFHYNSSKDIPFMGVQQPKLAPLPAIKNFQETGVAVANVQNIFPGHAGRFSMSSAHPQTNVYSHASANQPYPNTVPLRSSPRMIPSADHINFSAADSYRRQHEVTALGENVPAPFTSFETTGFPPEILREMHFAGFLSPTPVQAQTWPVALQGRDIIAIAKTGSGKTLGYLIPAFLHLGRFRNDPKIGPTVLVLAPTRELATQIQDEAIKFGRSSGISCICLYGGAPKGPQLREIEHGADIVVATPGRMNDILEMNKINFRQVSFLVLDEADRMLDMGFEPQIRKIVIAIPPRRQTLMYTATWPKDVRKIAGDLLFNPVQVNIGSIDELSANKAITQYVEVVQPMDKQRRLEQILRAQEHGSKIIIFCSTKRLCDQLAHSMGRSFGATAIHGDKSQNERDWALNQFRSGRSPILVATDVAARGLDIKDIRVVINYDFPSGIEDYVHRIGRTGRAGATGVSYTFFCDQDWKYASDLIKVLEGANQRVPLEVRQMAARGGPAVPKDSGGLSQWDSDGGHRNSGGGRGMRGGMRDSGSGFGGRGGRGDFFRGRAARGRGFGGPGGAGNHGRGAQGRFGYMDGRGGRFGNRRPMASSRDHGYSRSPDRVRKWKQSISRSRSRSLSRSWTRSRSYSRSRSRSQSRSRSHSFNSPRDGNHNRAPRVSGFDVLPPCGGPGGEAFPVREMSPMSPGTSNRNTLPKNVAVEQTDQTLDPASATPGFSSLENYNGHD